MKTKQGLRNIGCRVTELSCSSLINWLDSFLMHCFVILESGFRQSRSYNICNSLKVKFGAFNPQNYELES